MSRKWNKIGARVVGGAMVMSKEDRFVHWSAGAMMRMAPGEARRVADDMEAEFISRFPPAPSVPEQAQALAIDRGCIGRMEFSPQEVAEIVVTHIASTLPKGQHIEFAMAHPVAVLVALGIGESAQTVSSEDVGEIELSDSPAEGGELPYDGDAGSPLFVPGGDASLSPLVGMLCEMEENYLGLANECPEGSPERSRWNARAAALRDVAVEGEKRWGGKMAWWPCEENMGSPLVEPGNVLRLARSPDVPGMVAPIFTPSPDGPDCA